MVRSSYPHHGIVINCCSIHFAKFLVSCTFSKFLLLFPYLKFIQNSSQSGSKHPNSRMLEFSPDGEMGNFRIVTYTKGVRSVNKSYVPLDTDLNITKNCGILTQIGLQRQLYCHSFKCSLLSFNLYKLQTDWCKKVSVVKTCCKNVIHSYCVH